MSGSHTRYQETVNNLATMYVSKSTERIISSTCDRSDLAQALATSLHEKTFLWNGVKSYQLATYISSMEEGSISLTCERLSLSLAHSLST